MKRSGRIGSSHCSQRSRAATRMASLSGGRLHTLTLRLLCRLPCLALLRLLLRLRVGLHRRLALSLQVLVDGRRLLCGRLRRRARLLLEAVC